MRIDKYLKLTRLIKRRTVAKELLDRDIFYVNNKIAKPSTQVNVGDIIILILGRHKLIIRVEKIVDYVKKENVNELYTLLEDEIIEDIKY